jgi:hypothetical protein
VAALREALIAAGAALVLAACAARAEIVADRAPPPAPIDEPAHGESGYVWVRGDWAWDGGQWHWREGHWQRSRGNEYTWIDGHWQKRGERWVWIEGRWQRSAGGGGGAGRSTVHDHGGHR